MSKVFFSLDIEADGRSPSTNNMLSIGIVVFDIDGNELEFYQSNIIPEKEPDIKCINSFWILFPEAWEFIQGDRKPWGVVMIEINKLYAKYYGKGFKIEWVAGPAAYDWQWLNYYYSKFLDLVEKEGGIALDIGYSCRCSSEVEKYFWKMNRKLIPQKEELKDQMADGAKHTHKPHEDARREGRIFIKMHKMLGIPL